MSAVIDRIRSSYAMSLATAAWPIEREPMQTVSLTAYAIATARAMERELPEAERLFDDPFATIFAAGGAEAAEGTKRFLELPFLRDAIRLRTRFNDDFVRDGLARGLDQVVLMGAGFDARALRIPEIAQRGARVYEVDFAVVLDRKRELLAAAGIASPPHRFAVACDFMNPEFPEALTRDLVAKGFRVGGGAIFVWEGVLAYIDRAAIDRTLTFMARVGGPKSRLTFEYGGDVFAPDTAATVTAAAGFDRLEEHGYAELWKRWLHGEPHENAAIVRAAVASVA